MSGRCPPAACCVVGSHHKAGRTRVPGVRHRATAVERAIDRLRMDLVREGVIFDSDLSSSSKDEGQQELLGTHIGE